MEIGEEVRDLDEGDLAVVMVRRPCPHEHFGACRNGRPDFCYTGDFTERGIKGKDGFGAEFVVDHEKYMVPLPDRVEEVGVLVEPLTIAEKALLQIRKIEQQFPEPSWHKPGFPEGCKGCHNALILGVGPVCIPGAMTFQSSGYDTACFR